MVFDSRNHRVAKHKMKYILIIKKTFFLTLLKIHFDEIIRKNTLNFIVL